MPHPRPAREARSAPVARTRGSVGVEMAMSLALGLVLVACRARTEEPVPPVERLARPESVSDVDPSSSGQDAAAAARSGTLYVPAYSNLTTAEPGRLRLGITLSVRNVDPRATITLRFVDYYDTPGHRVRRYLPEPKRIGPLGTEEFVVAVQDEFGGPGANFLVGWSAPGSARPPLAETLMVGHAGAGYVSFTSRGVEIEAAATGE